MFRLFLLLCILILNLNINCYSANENEVCLEKRNICRHAIDGNCVDWDYDVCVKSTRRVTQYSAGCDLSNIMSMVNQKHCDLVVTCNDPINVVGECYRGSGCYPGYYYDDCPAGYDVRYTGDIEQKDCPLYGQTGTISLEKYEYGNFAGGSSLSLIGGGVTCQKYYSPRQAPSCAERLANGERPQECYVNECADLENNPRCHRVNDLGTTVYGDEPTILNTNCVWVIDPVNGRVCTTDPNQIANLTDDRRLYDVQIEKYECDSADVRNCENKEYKMVCPDGSETLCQNRKECVRWEQYTINETSERSFIVNRNYELKECIKGTSNYSCPAYYHYNSASKKCEYETELKCIVELSRNGNTETYEANPGGYIYDSSAFETATGITINFDSDCNATYNSTANNTYTVNVGETVTTDENDGGETPFTGTVTNKSGRYCPDGSLLPAGETICYASHTVTTINACDVYKNDPNCVYIGDVNRELTDTIRVINGWDSDGSSKNCFIDYNGNCRETGPDTSSWSSCVNQFDNNLFSSVAGVFPKPVVKVENERRVEGLSDKSGCFGADNDAYDQYVDVDVTYTETYEQYYCYTDYNTANIPSNCSTSNDELCLDYHIDARDSTKAVCRQKEVYYTCSETVSQNVCAEYHEEVICNDQSFPIPNIEMKNDNFTGFAESLGILGMLDDINSIWSGKYQYCSYGYFVNGYGGVYCNNCKGEGGFLCFKKKPEQQKAYEMNKKGLCHYLGTECTNEIKLGFGSICIEHTRKYCCYDSKLARVIVEQAYLQLGKSWNEGCNGLTVDDLNNLDFSAMDFSEIEQDLQSKIEARTNKINDVLKDRIKTYYTDFTNEMDQRGTHPQAPDN